MVTYEKAPDGTTNLGVGRSNRSGSASESKGLATIRRALFASPRLPTCPSRNAQGPATTTLVPQVRQRSVSRRGSGWSV